MMRPHALVLPALLALSATCAAAPLTTPSAGQSQRDQLSPLVHQAQATVEIIAPSAPPPPRVEEPPPPPSSVVVWHPGHWNWTGSAWVWVTGQYVERPRPQAAWIPGHWTQEPDGWRWDDGRWQ
jgi:hypothetical protein